MKLVNFWYEGRKRNCQQSSQKVCCTRKRTIAKLELKENVQQQIWKPARCAAVNARQSMSGRDGTPGDSLSCLAYVCSFWHNSGCHLCIRSQRTVGYKVTLESRLVAHCLRRLRSTVEYTVQDAHCAPISCSHEFLNR